MEPLALSDDEFNTVLVCYRINQCMFPLRTSAAGLCTWRDVQWREILMHTMIFKKKKVVHKPFMSRLLRKSTEIFTLLLRLKLTAFLVTGYNNTRNERSQVDEILRRSLKYFPNKLHLFFSPLQKLILHFVLLLVCLKVEPESWQPCNRELSFLYRS